MDWILLSCKKGGKVKITKSVFLLIKNCFQKINSQPLFIISFHMKYCGCLHKSQIYSGILNPMLILRYAFRAPPQYPQFFVSCLRIYIYMLSCYPTATLFTRISWYIEPKPYEVLASNINEMIFISRIQPIFQTRIKIM